MKKTVLISGALFAAALIAASASTTVSADDGESNTGNSNADFTIKGDGANEHGDTLYLSAEPSFTFNDASLKSIMSQGQTLSDESNAAKTLTVNDFTGDSLGWTVKAKLSAFSTADGSDSITAKNLIYTQTGADGLNFASADDTTTNPVTLTGSDSTVLAAAPGDGQGTTNTTASEAKLELPQDKTAKAEQYKADITWTLSQAAPVEGDEGAH